MTTVDPDFDPLTSSPPPRRFEVDQNRWEMLQSMFLSGLGKDNQKQVVKLIAHKDRRISSIAKEKIQTLWNSISEFKQMFNGQEACLTQQCHYKEALVEILTQQSAQTACWKLSVTESINPFNGRLIIGCWAAYGIQRRECQFFADRADRLSEELRKKFRLDNGLLSEDDESDDDSDNSDGDVDDQGRKKDEGEGKNEHREGENGGESDKDEFSECDDDFMSRCQQTNCDVMPVSSSPNPPDNPPGNPPAGDLVEDQTENRQMTVQEILDYQIQRPEYDWSADEPIPSLTEISPVQNSPRNEPPVIPPPGESPNQNDPDQIDPNQIDPNQINPNRPSEQVKAGPSKDSNSDQAILKHLAQKYPTLKNLDKVDLNQDQPVYIRSPKPTPKSVKSSHRDGKNTSKTKGRGPRQKEHQRRQRDQVGCSRYFQRSLVETREAEVRAAKGWGRRSAGARSGPKEAPKRQHHFTPPMPKRGRSNEANQLREMSNQFQQCLSMMTSQLDGFRNQVQNLNHSLRPQVRNQVDYDLPEDLPVPINTKPKFYRGFIR